MIDWFDILSFMRYRSYNNGSNFIWLGLSLFLMFGGFRLFFALLPILTMIFLIGFAFNVFRVGRKIFNQSQINDYVKGTSTKKQHFVELMIRIICHIVKADGRIDQREIQAIVLFFQQRLRYGVRQLMWVQDLLQHSMRTTQRFETVCREIKSQFSSDEIHLLLELVFEVASADGVISKEELHLIQQMKTLLNISDTIFQSIQSQYMNASNKTTVADDYYSVLGLTQNATKEEIKKAYKDCCKKYHPDKVQHLGDEFKLFADEKIKQVNEAYNVLYKQV